MAMPNFTDGDILYAASLNTVADEVDALRTDKVDKTTTVNGHALSGNITVTKANVGLGNVDNTSDANKPVSTAQQTALDLKVDKTTTVNGKPLSGNVTLAKGDVGLGNVDNTSDASKPISTATQTALNGKANTSHTHDAGDVTSGTFAAARLPAATESAIGAVERATNAEALAGTDTTRYVSPAGLQAAIAAALAPVSGTVTNTGTGTTPSTIYGGVIKKQGIIAGINLSSTMGNYNYWGNIPAEFRPTSNTYMMGMVWSSLGRKERTPRCRARKPLICSAEATSRPASSD